LGAFFLRLTVLRWQRRIIYIAVVVSTVWGIAMFFFAVLRCSRYDGALAFISKALQHECASDSAALGMTYTYGVITTLTDWAFLILPVFILQLSLMTRREKWTLGIIFGFASMLVFDGLDLESCINDICSSGIASFVRFKYINGFAAPQQDFFFVNARNIAIWSSIELGVGIIAACLITLWPLVHRISTSSSTHSTAYQDIERRPPADTKVPSKEAPSEPPENQAQVPAYIAAYQNEKDRQLGNPWIVNFFNNLANGKTKESGLPLDIFGTNALNTQSDDQDRDIESLRRQWRATTATATTRSDEPSSHGLPDEHFRWDRHVRASKGWDKPLPPVPQQQDLSRRSLRWSQNPPHSPPPPLPQTVYAPRNSERRSSGRQLASPASPPSRKASARQHASPATLSPRKTAAVPRKSPAVPTSSRQRRNDHADDGRGQRWDYVFNSLTETQKRDPALGLDIFGSSAFPSQSDDVDD
jgi:hypothetical protein